MNSTGLDDVAGNQDRDRRTLPVRLRSRDGSRKGCGCVVGGAFLIVAGFLLFNAYMEGNWIGWFQNWWANTFLILAAVMFALEIRTSLAPRVSPPIVEIEKQPIHPGESIKLCVRQEGPVSLKSLRANLICLGVTKEFAEWHRGNEPRHYPTRTTERETLTYTRNLLDVRNLKIASGDSWEQVVDLTVPPEAPPSARRKVVWKIELWGRVRFWPNFMHPYVIRVEAPTNADPDSSTT